MARDGSIEKENKMAYKLLGEMLSGAVNASVVPTNAGGGATLVRISVSSAQDVIQTRGGQVIGRVHLVANESIELTKKQQTRLTLLVMLLLHLLHIIGKNYVEVL